MFNREGKSEEGGKSEERGNSEEEWTSEDGMKNVKVRILIIQFNI